MSGLSHSPVIVDLAVTQDASGNVSIYSQAAPTITQEVIVQRNLSLATTLYGGDASGAALFRFQGQGNDIAGHVNATFKVGAETALTSELQACLCGNATNLDATAAEPFNAAKYSAVSEYKNMATLGDLALAYYANYLFGHVQATAAIDNDTSIVSRFNGQGAENADVAAGLANKVVSMDAAAATAVVKQVLGQDSTRAEEVDNDLSSPASFQNLKWIAGDVIYVTVNITRPNVSISDDPSQAGADAGVAGTTAGLVPASKSFMMKITLTA